METTAMETTREEIGGLGDDPTVTLEREISATLIERGKEMLAKILVGLNHNGCDPVRVFRLLENISKHHRELIAALHGGDTFQKKHGGLWGLGEDGISSMGVYGNQEENFGAQAIKGLVEGLKKPRDKGGEIKSLTEALSVADKAGMDVVAGKLHDRLDKLLDEEVVDEPKSTKSGGQDSSEEETDA